MAGHRCPSPVVVSATCGLISIKVRMWHTLGGGTMTSFVSCESIGKSDCHDNRVSKLVPSLAHSMFGLIFLKLIYNAKITKISVKFENRIGLISKVRVLTSF